MKRLLVVVLIILLLPSLAIPQTSANQNEENTVHLNVPAVTNVNGEYRGVSTSLQITVEPGDGHIYMETWPLSEVDMQASARLAIQTATQTLNINPNKYDYHFSINSDSPIIGGPSAGGVMTVGVIAAIKNLSVNPNVMMTGMINPDGSIGPVGGIVHKANASRRAGATKFLVPYGQLKYQDFQTGETIDVEDYADDWNLEIVEVGDIYEVVKHYTGYEIERPSVGSVEINLDFLEGYAESDITETEDMLQRAEELIDTVDYPYWGDKDLKTSYESAKNALDDAKTTYNNTNYYTSLSKTFQARINLNYIINYLEVYREEGQMSKIVEEEIKKTEQRLDEVNNQIKDKEKFSSIEELQGFAAAQNRIGRAEDLIETSKNSLETGDLIKSVYDYSRAQERLSTAIFWYQLSNDLNKKNQTEIPIEQVKYQAQNFIHSTRLLKIYLENLSGTTQETPMLDRARENLENQRYAAALYNAMEARSTLESIIVSMGSNEESLEKRIEQAEKGAKIAIGKLQDQGIQPILGLSYYEFAQFYKNSDKITTLIYLKQARLSSTAFIFQETNDGVELNKVDQNQEEKEEKQNQLNLLLMTTSITLILGGILGFLIGRKTS